MSNILIGLVVFAIFGTILFTTQSFGNSLDTSSEINKIGTLKISDSTDSTLIGLNLGVPDSITSVTLTFQNNIPNNSDVTISLIDDGGFEIGTGSITVTPSSSIVVITLSDSVTGLERETLRSASVTIS